MFGRLWPYRDRVLFSAGERARLAHERWLDRALTDPTRRWPVIPLRRVVDGGFGAITATPEGRAWADLWWDLALDRLELEF